MTQSQPAPGYIQARAEVVALLWSVVNRHGRPRANHSPAAARSPPPPAAKAGVPARATAPECEAGLAYGRPGLLCVVNPGKNQPGAAPEHFIFYMYGITPPAEIRFFAKMTFVPCYLHAQNGVCVFRSTTRSRPRLGLVVRCGDLALSQKKHAFLCVFLRAAKIPK